MTNIPGLIKDIQVEGFSIEALPVSGTVWQLRVAFEAQDIEAPRKMMWFENASTFLCSDWTIESCLHYVFVAIQRAMEHELRERFTFCGRRIYNPHVSLEELMRIAPRTVEENDRELAEARLLLRKVKEANAKPS